MILAYRHISVIATRPQDSLIIQGMVVYRADCHQTV